MEEPLGNQGLFYVSDDTLLIMRLQRKRGIGRFVVLAVLLLTGFSIPAGSAKQVIPGQVDAEGVLVRLGENFSKLEAQDLFARLGLVVKSELPRLEFGGWSRCRQIWLRWLQN